MKKMFALAILMVGISSFAQESPKSEKRLDKEKMEKLTPEQRNEKHLKKLTSDLGLNASQQKQMGTVLAEQSKKREAKKAEREKLMKADRSEREKEMAANDAKVKAILTPEQYTKWEQLKAEKRETGKKKFHKRKGNGDKEQD
jgi:periplasmic protein CpxP/Spy